MARRAAFPAWPLALVVGLAGAPVVQGQPEPRSCSVSNPDWVTRATPAEISTFYAGRAVEIRAAGRAILLCTVGESGALEDCEVTSETPSGMGFGNAALRLSSFFRMKTQYRDGPPTTGCRVIVPLRFTPPGDGRR